MRGASDVLRRAGTFAVVLMLVTSMVAPTAMAATTSTTADDDDACEKYNAYEQQVLGSLLSGQFDTLSDRCKAEELAGNITWADMYASGLGQADLHDGSLTAINNHRKDSKTYARTITKTEAVKLFNNESNNLTKSEIKAQVNDSIESYYATMQYNMLSTYSANINQAWYVHLARNQTGIEPHTTGYWYNYQAPLQGVNRTELASDETFANESYSGAHFEHNNITVKLIDGSNRTIPSIQLHADGTSAIDASDPTNQTAGDRYPDIRYRTVGFYVADPTANWGTDGPDVQQYTKGNSTELYDGSEYRNAWLDTNETAKDMKHQAAQFVDLLYSNYNRSEGVDITEVLNPNDLASQWNTNYNSTGYYGWIAATLGITGLEGNVNSSFAINYTPRVDHYDNGNYSLNGNGTHDYAFVNGTSYNISGTLMTDWDPNPNESYAFERGATYDTANADAPVLFIEQVNDTKSRVVRLNGTFAVDTLTNVKTGEEINATSLEEQNQQTWNESSSVNEIQKLVEYRNKSVNVIEAGGGGTGGGGGGFNFDFGAAGFGFIAIAGGALLLLSNRAS